MFRDMMIHDLDMACWLLNEEPVGLFAAASVMVDPAIGEAGDVDTAVVTLRMKSGALCQIANTRRAIWTRPAYRGARVEGWASGRERR